MRICLRFVLAAMVALTGVSTANADILIVGVNGSMSAGGATTTIEGDQFVPGGSSTRWTGGGVVGTDWVGTTGGTPPPATNPHDWYLQVSGAPITGLALDTAANRYVEVFYSIGVKDFTPAPADAADNRFFLNGTGQNPDDATNQALIPNIVGTHSFVIDVLSGDPASGITGNWSAFRWDMFNNPANVTANSGVQFTLDRVVFGTELTAIPEPGSLIVLGLGGVGMLLRRRK